MCVFVVLIFVLFCFNLIEPDNNLYSSQTWLMFFPSLVQRMVLDSQELILNRLKDIRKVNMKEKHDPFFIASWEFPFLQKK